MKQVEILFGNFTNISEDEPGNNTGLPICIVNALIKKATVNRNKAEDFAEYTISELGLYDSYVIPELFNGNIVYGQPSQLMLDNADILVKVLDAIHILKEIDGETMDYIIRQLGFNDYLHDRYNESF